MSAKEEVLQASKQFYSALNRMLKGDTGPLANVWSHGSTVTAMHPIGGREIGWEKVADSFKQVAGIASGGEVALIDQRIEVDGNMAYEVGTEKGQATFNAQNVSIEHRVTNVYRKEAGAWKMVHHHTDISPAMVDIVKSLQAKK
jgi:ketosteroid isomerase-like protein